MKKRSVDRGRQFCGLHAVRRGARGRSLHGHGLAGGARPGSGLAIYPVARGTEQHHWSNASLKRSGRFDRFAAGVLFST